MSEALLTEQLDQAISAMLRNPEAPLTAIDPTVAGLAEIAFELRALPRAEFKASLKRELEGEASMRIELDTETASGSPEPARATFRTLTPYLTVANVPAEIEFVTRVFGAEGKIYGLGSAGGFHSEYRIGDSMVMIGGGGEGSNWQGTPAPASLHLYVEDVDAVYQSALVAGATSLYAPMDQEYGDRDAGIVDAGGNQWFIGTRQGAAFPAGASNLIPCLHPQGAPKMIEFLETAFGAEPVAVHQTPDGIVRHATIRIGTSMIEMGEAHGQWQPMPMTFMLYVDDVDAWYARAMKAEGSLSVAAPKDQVYGDRMGAVKDPFDNVWYIGTHLQVKESETTKTGRISMGAPKLFRIAVQVADLDKASAFYAQLLDDPGRRIPRGSRHYFDCGPVILALVDVAKGAHQEPKPIPDYVYFAVSNIDEIHERAKQLNCLAKDDVHGEDAGEIVKRPWGERSFYAEDPWGNGLCFVDETTLFTGK
jgi:uncharacterized glyoxalase superfamily protein PhnB/predicted enzyme related to lactoylglutathione lyase